MSRPAIFLDRDGVLNEPVARATGLLPEAPLDPAYVRLAPGAIEGLRQLREAGFLLICVSNQPGAAKQECSYESLHAVHERVAELLSAGGVHIDGWYYCYHHPKASDPGLRHCACRKPAPGLILRAAAELDADLGASWMVGDSDADIGAGRRAGCATVLIQHPATEHRRAVEVADIRVADLGHAWDVLRPVTTKRSAVASDG